MSEENVVRLCAPTLAGIKTGSLFPCPFENRETLLMEIRQYNQVLVPKGLCLLPLRFTDKSALLYLYRPRDLERDLQDRLAAEILQHAGYVCGSSEQCLMTSGRPSISYRSSTLALPSTIQLPSDCL